MTTTDCDADDVVIPGELAAALQRAASAVPAADLHPREPRRRHAARRRRRTTVAACATSAVVLVAAVLFGRTVTRPSARPDIAVADQPTTTVAGEAGAGPHEPVLLPGVHAELLPDGTVRRLPRSRPGDVPRGAAVRLSDGRLVTLARRDLGPGAPRDDGIAAGTAHLVLTVFDTEGRRLGEHDVGRVGEEVTLAGARDDQVVLVRRGGSSSGYAVSTIDPTTFEETPTTEIDRPPGINAMGGDRLVLVDEGPVPECHIAFVDLVSGESGRVDPLPCIGLTAVSVSPDGSRVAVVIDRRAGIGITGGTGGTGTTTANAVGAREDIVDRAVVFVDLDDGTVLDSERFDITAACASRVRPECGRPLGAVAYLGLAWRDDDRVELVVQDPDPGGAPQALDAATFVPERVRTVAVDIAAR
ncbi:MAG TPA: hypothetical protein VGO78_20395 [Acidimicrobiales bacterium]|nr:hypothetical protein [Acidimicrobiales bacterium]